MTIAALFVDPKGSYSGLPDVDLWDEARDARLYAGPWPVVAHPPCSRWCRLAGLVEARWGHKRGEDGGCFASALASVRTWGGVLEHPAYTDAWAAFGLPKPPRHGGWLLAFCGGWVCHVEQGRYGHPAKKATWLYAFGCELPALRWGSTLDTDSNAGVSWCGNKPTERRMVSRLWREQPRDGVPADLRPRLGARAAAATPDDFRDVLLGMARSVPHRSPGGRTGVELQSRAARIVTPPEFRDVLLGMARSASKPEVA